VEEREGNLRRAIEAYEAALEHYQPETAPLDYAMTQNNLGTAYRALSSVEEREGNLRRAIEAYDEAIRLQSSASRHDLRGETHRMLGQYDKALVDFTRSLELSPGDAWTLSKRGQVLHELKRYDEALADFDTVISLNAGSPWYWYLHAETHRTIGQYNQALSDINQAVELSSEYVWGIMTRGRIQSELKNYDAAIADFNKAIEIDPNLFGAFLYRAETYQDMRDFERSESDYNRCIELKERAAFTLRNRAGFYLGTHRLDEAESDLAESEKAEPDAPYLFYHRARLLVLRNQPQDALNLIEQASQRDNAYHLLPLIRALAHLVLGQAEIANTDVGALLNEEVEISSLHDAIEVLESFIEHRPQVPNAESLLEKVQDELSKRTRRNVYGAK
jgi:tetratricopeptide (TPR) repeat protein